MSARKATVDPTENRRDDIFGNSYNESMHKLKPSAQMQNQ